MSIKVKLIILAVVSLVATVAIGFILFQNTVTVKNEIEKERIISAVQNNLFEREVLRDDYFLYHEARPIDQLKIVSVALDQLLMQASKVFISADEQAIISRLSDNKKFIDQSLSKIVTGSPSAELEQSLVSQILVKSQENITIASKLADNSRNNVTASQQRAIFFVLMFIVGISLIIIIAFYFIWRSVGEPIITLKEAVVRIAALDFSTTITTTSGGGELGELGRAFNQMVIKLKESYSSLENRTQDLKNVNVAAQNVLEDLNIEKSKTEMANAKDEAMLDSIGDGVFAIDKTGIIIIFNRKAEEISGWRAVEALGKQYRKILKFAMEDKPDVIKDDFISQALGGKKVQIANHAVIIRKDGTKLPVADSAAPVLNDEGKVQAVVVVFRDVTKERAVDQAKTEFVSLASHQLRTPLSVVNWYTEMLLTGDVGKLNAEQKKYLDEVYRGNQRMVTLVNALLNVSRLELGTFVIEPKPTDMSKAVQDTIDEYKKQVDDKKIKLSRSLGKDIPVIPADPKLLHMIIENILSNSIKYTPEGGRIEVSLSLDNQKNVLLKISDTGYGIPKNQQDKIFTKLFRADNVREKDTEGTGLGLYIVKTIIDNSDGKIWFTSEENKGTTFFVTIPITGMKKKEGTKTLS